MKKTMFRRIAALVSVLCLFCCGVFAHAEEPAADLEALYPLMDLVCAAGYDPALGTSVIVPDSEGMLEISFVDAFIRLAVERNALGAAGTFLTDTAAQSKLLGSIFAAQIPATETVVATEPTTQYIGFKPVTVNTTGLEGTLQIAGEMYIAPKAITELTEEEFGGIVWLDRGIFTFRSDATGYSGFRLMGFSTGLELSAEEEMQSYSESIVVEYVNTNLGFMVLYPSVFTDAMLVEDATGVSAALPDNSVSFFARRTENADGSSLKDHVTAAAAAHENAATEINEELFYGTVSYIADGYAVYDVYVVTGQYVYQAQLKYLTTLMSEYSLYNTYLLNSFGVDELAAG